MILYLNFGEGTTTPIASVSKPVYACCASQLGSVTSLKIQKHMTPTMIAICVKYCTARRSITRHSDFHVFLNSLSSFCIACSITRFCIEGERGGMFSFN